MSALDTPDTNHDPDIDIDTVIIGAGQTGLATGDFLRQRGIPFVILDASARVGDHWRRQWDSLRLYSPAHVDGLPGLPFPAERWTFPGKDAVGDYLESYAGTFALPVRLETRVQALDPADPADMGDEGYVVTTDRGRWACRNVVVCTGTFCRTGSVPDIAAELDPAILQLHSSEYRRPSQINEGSVLVVGASHSGTDIAYELAETHPTILAGRDCGEIPPRLGSPVFRVVFPVCCSRGSTGAPRVRRPLLCRKDVHEAPASSAFLPILVEPSKNDYCPCYGACSNPHPRPAIERSSPPDRG